MKMESTRKLSKVNFQWTETVYQNNNNNNNNNITEFAFFSTFSKG